MSTDNNNNEEEEEEQPKTALIVVGDAMFFQPTKEVVSVTILAKSAMKTALTSVANKSLENLHLVVKGVDVSTMHDGDAITVYADSLQEDGTISAHLLVSNEGAKPAEEDLQTVKTSFVMAGLKIVGETQNPDGSIVLTGQKSSSESWYYSPRIECRHGHFRIVWLPAIVNHNFKLQHSFTLC